MESARESLLQSLFGVLLAAGIVALGFGFGALAESNRLLGVAVGVAGIAIIASIFVWLPRSAARGEEARKQADIKRGEETAERVAQTGESFHVGAGSLMPLAMLLTAVAVAAFYADFTAPSWGAHMFGGLATLGACFAWMSAVPRMRSPQLCFERGGVRTALYGFLPWECIEDMNLVRNTHRSMVCMLELHAPGADELRPQMHPCGRLYRRMAFGASGRILRFSVPGADALFAHRLAFALWQRHTGRKAVCDESDRDLALRLPSVR